MRPEQALETVAQEIARVVGEVDPAEVGALVEALVRPRQVFVTGQGRSGLVARAFAMRLAQAGLRAYVAGDPTTGPIGAGDLLVVASGSGETASSVTAACTAQGAGAQVALLTIRADSSIGEMADLVVRIPAPSPKAGPTGWHSAQPLGSLFEQALLAVLDAAVLALMDRLGETPDSMFARHANLE